MQALNRFSGSKRSINLEHDNNFPLRNLKKSKTSEICDNKSWKLIHDQNIFALTYYQTLTEILCYAEKPEY